MNIIVLAAYWEGREMIPATIKEATGTKPDLHDYEFHWLSSGNFIFSGYDLIVYVGVNGGNCLPDKAAFHKLRDTAPTILICPEASDRIWWHPLLTQYAQNDCFDLMVNIDGNPDWPGSDRGITALTPRAVEPWGDPLTWGERLIPCGFCGNNGSPGRAEMLRALGASVLWRGGDPRPNTWPDYVAWTKQCKMVINMAAQGAGARQHVKGRVVEAGLGGAFVLETHGSPLRRWFEPGIDYAEYSNAEDARTIIGACLKNPAPAILAAGKMHAKILRDHSSKAFWGRIFDALGMGEKTRVA